MRTQRGDHPTITALGQAVNQDLSVKVKQGFPNIGADELTPSFPQIQYEHVLETQAQSNAEQLATDALCRIHCRLMYGRVPLQRTQSGL